MLPLVPDRTCGGCTECCRAIPLSLPELSKPTGKLCAYAVEDGGCSVHAIRPEACRTWFCLWRVVDLPESWRPDRSGVILRPDGLIEGRITIHVERPNEFLGGDGFFLAVSQWMADGLHIAVSVPGPVGTFPAIADATEYLRAPVEAGDPAEFLARLLRLLDSLSRHDFEPDGLVEHYAVK
jgi:hypothetical protein